jgi:nitrous oxide reductase accessory protein NosL
MFPAKQPKSTAGMILADGRSYYFCSNSCLLRTYRHPSIYLGGEAPVVVRMLVLDYFSGASIDADSAWWVAGSDVIGPMGPALVALGSRSDAAAFVQRHGGREVFQIKTTDDVMWERLLTPHRK